MRSSKIVVTCNPSRWEGDFRLWEAMVSGALVFVDTMHVPTPHAFADGEHLVVFDSKNEAAFHGKLGWYLDHPAEARRIARAGFLYALKYHRTVSRIDWILRSSDLAQHHIRCPSIPSFPSKAASALLSYSTISTTFGLCDKKKPEYTETAQKLLSEAIGPGNTSDAMHPR